MATHKCTRTEDSLIGPETVQGSVPKSDCVDSHKQLNSGSLYIQTGSNPRSTDVCSPVEIHELVSSLQNRTACQANSRVTQIQSLEWSLHP